MPLVRFRIDILGMFEGNPQGVKHGEVVDLNAMSAERYVRSGYADYVAATPVQPPVEKAVAPEHETAKLEIPPEVAALGKPAAEKPKPLDEPEEEAPEYGDTDPPDGPPRQLTKRRASTRRAGR